LDGILKGNRGNVSTIAQDEGGGLSRGGNQFELQMLAKNNWLSYSSLHSSLLLLTNSMDSAVRPPRKPSGCPLGAFSFA